MPGLFDLGNRPASGPPTNLFCVGSEPLRAVTRGKAPCAVDHPGRPQALSWGSPMMRLLCARDPAHELCTGRPRGSRGPIRGTPILEPPDGLLRCPAIVLPVCPDLTFLGCEMCVLVPSPGPRGSAPAHHRRTLPSLLPETLEKIFAPRAPCA